MVFIASVKKKMFKCLQLVKWRPILLMQMQGTANLQSCQKQTLHQFTRHLPLALIYSSNAMKCVKVQQVLTEVETC